MGESMETEPMETMVEAIARLRADGYGMDVSAVEGGLLRCGICGELVDAHDAVVAHIVRFEGATDPDDEAILVAIDMPEGHRGLYTTGYGPAASAADGEVLRALATR